MSIKQEVVDVKDWIIERIQSNEFKESSPLPSEYEISRAVGVSRDDVEIAMHELITEQLITETFQEGYFVKHKPMFYYPINELRSITHMVEDAGYEAGTIIISQDLETPSLDDQTLLNIDDKEQITVIERIRTANGFPVAYCLDKLATNQYFNDDNADSLSLFDALKDHPRFNISYATCEIEAISYEPYISQALECAPEESLLLFKQVHFNHDDEPVLYSMNYFRSSQMKFQIIREMK